MKFEIGKCYEHTKGQQMKIIGELESTSYGKTLVAELSDDSNFRPVGSDEASTQNYHEIPESGWLENFS